MNVADLSHGDLLEKLEILSGIMQQAVKDAPYAEYVPLSEKHRRFHESKARLRFIPGANRSGKSWMALSEICWNAVGWWPDYYPEECRAPIPSRQRIVTTTTSVHDRIVPFLLQMIPAHLIKNCSPQYHKFQTTNGSLVQLMTFNQEPSEFQSDSIHYCLFDEHCPRESIFEESWLRLMDVDGRMVVNLCPWIEESGGGLTWEYDRLYLPAMAGDPNVWMETFLMSDNPTMTKEKRDLWLSQFPREQREAREFGKFVRRGGLVIPEYQDAEPWLHRDLDLRGQKDRAMIRRGSLWMIIDPAQSRANVVVWVLLTDNGDYILDDIVENCSNEKLAAAIREKFAFWGVPDKGIIDCNANEEERTSSTTTKRQLQDLLGIPLVESVKHNEEAHISRIRAWFTISEGRTVPWLRVCRRAKRTRYELTHWGFDREGRRDKYGDDAVDCVKYYAAVRIDPNAAPIQVHCPDWMVEGGIWNDNALEAKRALGILPLGS